MLIAIVEVKRMAGHGSALLQARGKKYQCRTDKKKDMNG
jgi:hypothetical protein